MCHKLNNKREIRIPKNGRLVSKKVHGSSSIHLFRHWYVWTNLCKTKMTKTQMLQQSLYMSPSFFVHFEFTIIIDTDSFTIALQKFMARRGAIWEQNKQNKTNNKTNFVGSNIELQKTLNEMDYCKIKIFFQENYTDSIVQYKKVLTKKRNELKRSKTT